MTCYERNGWVYVSISGKPRERGVSYGKCVAKYMKRVFEMMDFMCMDSYGRNWSYFIDLGKKYYFNCQFRLENDHLVALTTAKS